MSNSHTAAQVLQGFLTQGVLASQYEAYSNVLRLKSDSWYTRLVNERGYSAAEAALKAWDRSERRSDYAASIEKVARGMLAMAQIDTNGEYTKAFEDTDRSGIPHYHDITGPSKIVVIVNQEAPGCGCNAPEWSNVWSPCGRLGLQAVTLQAGLGQRFGAGAAQLGLVLPHRGAGTTFSENSFIFATIDLTGSTDVLTNPWNLTKDWYLKVLGLTGQPELASRYWRGHFDRTLGFRDATDYLANALPKLGEYFTSLAAMLTDHDHKQ